MKLSFIILSLFTANIFAENATIIRSKTCVANTTNCRYTKSSESRIPTNPNFCELSYSYLLKQNITVIKSDGTVTTLKDPEETGHFKKFSHTFYYGHIMSEKEWDHFCMNPCKGELQEVINLYGKCS